MNRFVLSFFFLLLCPAQLCGQITLTGDNSHDYNGTDDPWSIEGKFYVGTTGEGHLQIRNGSVVNTVLGRVASSDGDPASVLVDGPDAMWNNSESLSVGVGGTGIVTVQNQGGLTSDDIVIGHDDTGSGELVVRGAGSTLVNTDQISIGAFGPAILRVEGGGDVRTERIRIYRERGLARIDGANSRLTVIGGNEIEGELHVANNGTLASDSTINLKPTGKLVLDNGIVNVGAVAFNPTQLAGTGQINARGIQGDFDLRFDATTGLTQEFLFNSEPGQNVTYQLDMSNQDNAGALGVGVLGNSTITVADGMQIVSDVSDLGIEPGSSGDAVITGAGTVWRTKGLFQAGDWGRSNVQVLNGATLHAGGMQNGFLDETNIIVDGTDSTLQMDYSLFVFGGSRQALKMTNGAKLIAGDRLRLSGNVLFQDASVGADRLISFSNIDAQRSTLNFRTGNAGDEENLQGNATFADQTQVNFSEDFTLYRGTMRVESGSTMSSRVMMLGGTERAAQIVLDGAGSSFTTQFLDIRSNAGITISNGATVQADSLTLHLSEPGIVLNDGVLDLNGGDIRTTLGTANFAFNGGRLTGVSQLLLFNQLHQKSGIFEVGPTVGETFLRGDYLFADGALEIELFGSEAGEFDSLRVSNGINLIGSDGDEDSELLLNLGYHIATGTEFMILENESTNATRGKFSVGEQIQAIFDGTTYLFEIDYQGGDGNDIVLRNIGAVPEPNSMMVLCLAAICTIAQRRRS
ncbi:MAG: PEP-CTERM sorting domain-containing protein [Planctomycetota bacterium]